MQKYNKLTNFVQIFRKRIMKRFALMIMAVLVMLPQAVSAQKNNDGAEGLKVMSYNIRLGSANDGTNA